MVVVGKKKFLKKDNSGFCYVVNILIGFSDNQYASGCLGMECKELFISEKFFEEIDEGCFGRECVFTYGMSSFATPEPVGLIFADEVPSDKK